MSTLDYHQTLEIVENFMTETGIRDFCTNVCKGSCCGKCYTSDNACHKHEGRRLACSAFVCEIPTLKAGTSQALVNGRYAVQKAITEVNARHNLLKIKPYIECTGEVHFCPPSPLVFTELKADADKITKGFVDLIDEVKLAVEFTVQSYNEIKNNPDEHSKRWETFKFNQFTVMKGKVVHYHIQGARAADAERLKWLAKAATLHKKGREKEKQKRSVRK
jgi:hypothetical protein